MLGLSGDVVLLQGHAIAALSVIVVSGLYTMVDNIYLSCALYVHEDNTSVSSGLCVFVDTTFI